MKLDKTLGVVITGAVGTGIVGGLTDQPGMLAGSGAVALAVGALAVAHAWQEGRKPARSNVIEGQFVEHQPSTDLVLSQVKRAA